MSSGGRPKKKADEKGSEEHDPQEHSEENTNSTTRSSLDALPSTITTQASSYPVHHFPFSSSFRGGDGLPTSSTHHVRQIPAFTDDQYNQPNHTTSIYPLQQQTQFPISPLSPSYNNHRGQQSSTQSSFPASPSSSTISGGSFFPSPLHVRETHAISTGAAASISSPHHRPAAFPFPQSIPSIHSNSNNTFTSLDHQFQDMMSTLTPPDSYATALRQSLDSTIENHLAHSLFPSSLYNNPFVDHSASINPSTNSYFPSIIVSSSGTDHATLALSRHRQRSSAVSPTLSTSMSFAASEDDTQTTTTTNISSNQNNMIMNTSIETNKTPPPQNLRGDPFRNAKVKTELCRHFNTERGCPFGDKCNYAHGEHELKYTKLMDLERAGLADVEIFRAHPCLTWIATGTCPFDQRCLGLHDSRISGNKDTPSVWLPHAETLINSIGSSGINVDKFYHERLASIYSCSPVYGYIPTKKWKADVNETYSAWKHFFEFVINSNRDHTGMNKKIKDDEQQQEGISSDLASYLSEKHVLEIVLKMREARSGQSFAYIPTHLLCGELCMVLQTKVFQLIPTDKSEEVGFNLHELAFSGESSAVSRNKFEPNLKQFQVHELAFGPIGDPSVRSLSIWFDLTESDMTECTLQQAKHHKRSRHRLKKARYNRRGTSVQAIRDFYYELNSKLSQKCDVQPFFCYEPHDNATYNFITRILQYQLKYLDYSSRQAKSQNDIIQMNQSLAFEQNQLLESFISLRRHWVTWSWPPKTLESAIDDESDVPPVDGLYEPIVDGVDSFQTETFHGRDDKEKTNVITQKTNLVKPYIWKSFIMNIQLATKQADYDSIRHQCRSLYDLHFSMLCRLPILRHLSRGRKLNKNRELPNLKRYSGTSSTSIDMILNEWKEIEQHYKNSHSSSMRSMKTCQSVSQNVDITDLSDERVNKYLEEASKMWNRC